jgi:hypothetical protein
MLEPPEATVYQLIDVPGAVALIFELLPTQTSSGVAATVGGASGPIVTVTAARADTQAVIEGHVIITCPLPV